MNTDVPVPPTPQVRQETFWGWIDRQVRSMIATTIETVLQDLQQAHLAAAWNQRTADRRGYRNGVYRRQLATPHGPMTIAVPRCRDRGLDCSAIFDRYQRRVADVERILRHAYLLGTSTRATAQLAEQVFGGQLSHQTVSRLMRWTDQQIRRWRCQPIEPVYQAVYIDGMHVPVLGGDRTVMLVCGLRQADGPLDVLGFCLSGGEQCLDLLADLRRRGLEGVQLFISDGSAALRSALQQVYPEVPWQECAFHRLKTLRENLGPADYRDALVAQAACIFRCPSRLAASDAAKAWADRWRAIAPGAVQVFLEALTNSLTFYQLPQAWWQRVRTNNPLERLIRTLRMRLDIMGCFHDPPAVERAVFGQLARWHRLGTYTQ